MKCAQCGSDDTQVVLDIKNSQNHFLTPKRKDANRKWHKCRRCGIGYSTPRLTEEEIEWMYENYRSTEFRNETPDEYFCKITTLPKDKSENFQKYRFIKDSLDGWEPGHALDIGCGGGVLIHELKKHWKNTKYYGIEPSPNFAELAGRKTGANITNGYFNKKASFGTKFDLILCCQVLEHIDDIEAFIEAMKMNLKKEGYIYLEVPDQSDFRVLNKDHSRFTEPSHLWYFSEDCLGEIVKRAKLEIKRCKVEKTIRGRNN